MPLRFKKLPLTEVTIRLGLTGETVIPLDLTFLDFTKKLSRFKRRQFATQHLVLGPKFSPPAFGQPFGLELFTDETVGTKMIIQDRLVAIQWRGIDSSSYIGFESLRAILVDTVADLLEEVREVRFGLANMSYANFVATAGIPKTEDVEEYFHGVIPDCAKGSVFDEVNLSWRKEDIEVRVQVNRVNAKRQNGLAVITTAGSFLASSDDPFPAVDSNHRALEELFPGLLTERAKIEWEFDNGPS